MNSLLVDLVALTAIALVVAGLIVGLYWLVHRVVRDGKTPKGTNSSDPADK